MRHVLRNTIAIGFAIALLGVVTDVYIGHRNIAELVETTRGVAQSRDVQDALEKLLSTVKDAETGQRGFIITGQDSYLQPFKEAVGEVRQRLDRVRELLADHPDRITGIERLTKAKLDELAETIDVYRTRGSDAATDVIRRGRGKELMDDLRREIAAVQIEEGRQLAARREAVAASLRHARLMNLLGGGAGVALVALAFYLFRRDRRTRESAAADLKRANDELEVRVARRTAALQQTADELSTEVRERRKVEEALRESQEQLERRVAERTTELRGVNARLADADRRKDEFLAMLAHELRNPLAPIRNAVSLLRKRPANDPVVDQMSAMLDRQVTHLAQLVDDLMDMARITSGKIELRLAPTDLATLVRRMLDVVGPLLAERRHKVTVDIPSGPIWVCGDSVRLEQILTNLLQNAAKYTPPGGKVRVSLEANGTPDSPDAQAILRVSDTGIGIRQEMLPRIFDMFQQGDRVQGKLIEGLGIGLTLVRNLVEMHGGTVEALSAGLGRGSEFVIRLPLTAPGISAPVPAVRPERRPRSVLVVDDNKDAAHSLAVVLEQEGHDVRVANDGPAALAAVETATPQVVLLDIGMPGMDGYEVARRMRQAPGFDATPIIALTGFGSAEDHRRGREAGFDQHLTKPVDPEALLDLLARV
jgi:signal transduction histidine kinase